MEEILKEIVEGSCLYTGTTINPHMILKKVKDQNVASVNINDATQIIAKDAFKNCSIGSLTIPSSIITIEEDAFIDSTISNFTYTGNTDMWCAINFKNIHSNPLAHSSESTPFGSSISINAEKIGQFSFYNYRNLETVSISENVTHVGQGAFAGCSSLNKVKVSSFDYWYNIVFENEASNPIYYAKHVYDSQDTEIHNITVANTSKIGNYAFINWEGLRNITINSEINDIGYSVFSGCTNLTLQNDGQGLYIGSDYKILVRLNPLSNEKCRNTYCAVCDEVKKDINNNRDNYYLDNNRTILAKGTNDSTIPSSVKFILSSAFEDKITLTTITIPQTVKSIGSRCFANCKNLESIYFEDNSNLQIIGTSAFENCDQLSTITLPNNIKRIDPYTFTNCQNLFSIDFGNLELIPSYCCNNCTALKEIKFTNRTNSILIIGDKAFFNCENLVDFTCDNSLTNSSIIIGKDCFSQCDNLASISLTAHQISICERGFYGCQHLLKIYINTDTTPIIEKDSFANCYKIVEVCTPHQFGATAGSPAFGYLGYYAAAVVEESKNIGVKDNLVLYGDWDLEQDSIDYSTAFIVGYNGDQTEITLPEVYGIKSYAFYNTTNIVNINISNMSNRLKIVGHNAFDKCEKLQYNLINGGYYLGNGLIFIKPESLDITTLSLATQTKFINEGALAGCSNLTSLTLPFVGDRKEVGNKNYQNPFGYIFGKSHYTGDTANNLDLYINGDITYNTYYIPPQLNNIIINGGELTNGSFCNYTPANLTITLNNISKINDCAFYNTSLQSINIPSTVTSIGDYAFYNLENASISLSVDPIIKATFGEYSFYNCAGLHGEVEIQNSIGKYALTGCSNLTSVSILSTVEHIGDRAFYNLETLPISIAPGCTTSVGEYAFYNCTKLAQNISIKNNLGKYAFYNCDQLKNATITSTISNIDEYTFFSCNSLTSITIPNGITTLGASAFQDCSNATSLTIGTGVTNIPALAFAGCSALEEIIIPNNITTIGANAFSYCSSATNLSIGTGVTEIGNYAFHNCSAIGSITIPNGITTLGTSAFQGCSAATSLTIGTGVTEIGESAFSGCSHIGSITIPNGVTTLGASAFQGCSTATTLSIGTGVTEIQRSTFSGCSNLTDVNIGSGVTNIELATFSGCTKLTNITIPFVGKSANTRYADETTLFGYIFGKDSYTGGDDIVQYYSSTESETYCIPSSLRTVTVTNIDPLYGAFSNCAKLTDITFPNNITKIAESLCSGCSRLRSITIPNSVVYDIGNSAFKDCSSATSLTIGSGVQGIGHFAFEGCSSLTSITIPNNVVNIGTSVFKNCSSAVSLTLSTNLGQITSFAFEGCSSLTSITIPNSVTIIDSAAFNGCSSATTLSIGTGVTRINSSAFYDCSSLTSITIPNSVTNIADRAFAGCSAATSLTIGTGVTGIGDYAFFNCSHIASITIPNATTNIGDYTFQGCSAATSLTIGTGVTEIGESAFLGCSHVGSITIPNSVTALGASAFKNCSSATTLSIGTGLRAINESVFDGCAALNSITIPNNILLIDTRAFAGCSAATSLTIGTGVTEIGNEAFIGCSHIGSIVIPNNVTDIGASAFKNCSAAASLTIGTGVTEIADSMFYNCSSLTDINIPNNIQVIAKGAFAGCGSLINITLPFTGSDRYKTTAAADTLFGYIFGQTQYTGGTEVIQYYASGYSATYWIPSSLRTVAVTNINPLYGAFSNCTKLTSITFSSNITKIAESLCSGCSGLTSITIPNSVARIGASAFKNCSSATTLSIGGPDSVTIEGSVFSGCSGLISISIPGWDSVGVPAGAGQLLGYLFGQTVYSGGDQTIQYYSSTESVIYYIPSSLRTITCGGNANAWTFNRCTKLTSITFASGALTIGEHICDGCSGLTSITIPNSITSIGSYAFNGCSGATTLSIGTGVTAIYQQAFSGCSSLTSITIPTNVTSLGASVFENCSSATSLTISTNASLGTIPQFAFKGCSGLTSITIPNNITYIEGSAFENCSSATSLSISTAVTDLLDSVFAGCSNLTTIVVPNSVTHFGGSVFARCTKLENLTIPFISSRVSDAQTPGTDNLLGYLFGTTHYTGGDDTLQYYYDYNSTQVSIVYCIPSSLRNVTITTIQPYIGAFTNCTKLTGLTFPTNATAVLDFICAGCSGLVNISMPSTITSIGDNAFESCSSITSFTTPASVTSIGDNVFKNCSNMTNLTLSASVASIGDNAFQGCSGLSQANYSGSLSGWFAIDFSNNYSNPSYYTSNIYFSQTNTDLRGSVTVPSGSVLKQYALYNCSGITEITYSGTTVGTDACHGCSAIITVNAPIDSAPSIANQAYPSSSFTMNITSSNTTTIAYGTINAIHNLAHFIIQSNNNHITTIAAGAIQNCSELIEIVIPDSVTTVDTGSVATCTNLNSLTAKAAFIRPLIQYALSTNNFAITLTGTSVGSEALKGLRLRSLTISDGITSIGSDAFRNTTGSALQVNIPNSVTSIGTGAFRNSKVETVEIGSGVTTISNDLFRDCTSLTTVSVNNTQITSIGSYSFYNCTSLKIVGDPVYTSINLHNINSMGAYAFAKTSSVIEVMWLECIGNHAFYQSGVQVAFKIYSAGGSYCFSECPNLYSVDIGRPSSPIGVTPISVGSYAFSNSSALDNIGYLGTRDQWLASGAASDWRSGSSVETIYCDDYYAEYNSSTGNWDWHPYA